ncbi:MAG: tetratricopeptide repeat protein [Halothece sp. Uz-M2-17]|nr:tetratricopeptide repeat protein [Halothece sp. Uz-M2-17]
MVWQEDVASLIAQEDYQRAAEICGNIIDTNPEQIKAFFYLGVSYLLQGYVEEAQAVWLSGLFESPCDLNSEECNQILVQILKEQAQQETNKENYKNSQLIYQQLKELISDDPSLLLLLVKSGVKTQQLTQNQLKEWQVVDHLKTAPSTALDVNLMIEIFQLALQYPIPGIEPFVATLSKRMSEDEHFQAVVAENLKTLEPLAVNAYNTENYEAAIILWRLMLEYMPDSNFLHLSLGNSLKELGEIEAAQYHYETAISLDPEFAIAYHNLARLYQDKDEVELAISYYQKALDINKRLDKSYINLGLLYQHQGNRSGAIECYETLLKLYPQYAEGYNNLGILWIEEGNYGEAEKSFKYAIELKPEYADAYNNLGVLYQYQGKLELAESFHEEAIKCVHDKNVDDQLDVAKAHLKLGLIYFAQEDFDRAEWCYGKALEIKADYAEALTELAVLYRQTEELDKAITYLKQTIAVNPDFVRAYSILGIIYNEKGDLNTAQEFFEQAFTRDDNSVSAHFNFSQCHKYESIEDRYFKKVLELSSSQEIAYPHRKYIEFTVAKAWNDLREYEKEFAALNEANRLKREEFRYSVDKDLERFQKIKDQFNASTIFNLTLPNDSYQRQPIFIVGMPRSGTTLAEQIIASHSEVVGLGELRFLSKIRFEKDKDNQLLENLNSIDMSTLAEMQKSYLEKVSQRGNKFFYFTDKMPYNFQFIGLIKILFPNAKVIHCLRHPLDICIANYQRCFATRNYHSYNLQELGEYYLGYHKLMQHWYSVLPGFLYPLHYEKLVANQEEESKKLLEFCELKWEDNVLNFHENQRSIRTASVVQVRQKMYTSSAYKWQRYTKHIEPLKKLFEENGIL